MDLDQQTRTRWQKAAEQVDRTSSASSTAKESDAPQEATAPARTTDQAAEPEQPQDELETYLAPDDVPEGFRDQVYQWLAQADGLIRQGLELPEREGVEVELEPGDTLRMSARMMSPFLYEKRQYLTPESRALGGAALLVLDGLRDGGLEKIMEGMGGASEPEDYEEPPQGETADDF